jgi:hypothetical protein
MKLVSICGLAAEPPQPCLSRVWLEDCFALGMTPVREQAFRRYLVLSALAFSLSLAPACAAASRAVSTRNGEHAT